MREDAPERLDRLESLVESQQEAIENQQATIDRQQARIAELEESLAAADAQNEPLTETDDDSGTLPIGPSRTAVTEVLGDRRTLTTAGLLGLAGLGTGISTARTGTGAHAAASPSPRGRVGTSSQPLRALYTEKIDGPVTGDAVTDLLGDGLTVAGKALTVDLDAIAGDNLTVDTSNGELDASGGGSGGSTYVGASAYLSAEQSTSGETNVSFDTLAFDAGGNFDLAASTFTAPTDGYYAVTFKAYTEADLVSIQINGTDRVTAEPPILTRSFQLSAGDTVTASVDGGGSVYAGRDETYLTVDRIG